MGRIPDYALLPGFSLYQAWIYITFFSEVPYFSASDPALVRYWIYLESLGVLCVSLVAIALMPFLTKGRNRAAFGFAGAFALTTTSIAAPFSNASGVLSLAALHYASIASGVGTAILGTLWAISFRKAGQQAFFMTPAIILLEGVLVALMQIVPQIVPVTLAILPILSTACALEPLRRKRNQIKHGSKVPLPSTMQLFGYGFAWLLFGIALGMLIGTSGTESRQLSDATWLAIIALTALTVMAMMRAVGRPFHTGLESKGREDRPSSRIHTTESIALGTTLAACLLIPLFFGAFSTPSAGFQAPSLVSFALIELATLMLFASTASMLQLSISTVYGMGRAGRALGAFVGSLAGNVFVSAESSSPFNQIKIVFLVVGCEILLILAFVFAIRRSERAPQEANAYPASIDDACRAVQDQYRLSKRELDVLILLAKGWTQERIQEELKIARSTAATHINHVYQKLQVHSKQEVINLVERERIALSNKTH